MAAKVNLLAEKRIYIAELDINLTSLKDQYQGHELVYKKEFGINGIPIQFAVWDSNFNLSLNDKSAKKNLYIIKKTDLKPMSLKKSTNSTKLG